MIAFEPDSYYKVLKTRLHWQAGAEAEHLSSDWDDILIVALFRHTWKKSLQSKG